MRILVLGGTIFLGRHLVDAALRAGDQVTIFHRGKHPAADLPDVEVVLGDRDGGLDGLSGRTWDVAVDTCGYVPRIVGDSARFLRGLVEHYTFVSSVSAYASFAASGQDESAPVGTIAEPTVEEVTNETYGPLKVLCEQAAETEMPGRTLVVRPGLIVGPRDMSDRFTYWACRVAEGGQVLAPAPPDAPTQAIDVRDLAEWMLAMARRRAVGVYNATGPAEPLTFGKFLDACRAATSGDATIRWASEAFLKERGIDFPMWVPPSETEWLGIDAIDSSKAIAAGLEFRPLAETIGDTVRWARTRTEDHAWRSGPTRQAESEAIAALGAS